MHRMLFAATAVLGLAAGAAYAQTTGSEAGAATSPEHFLQRAQDELGRHQGRAAEVALEQAETRLLDRSVSPSMATQPDANPTVQKIAQARQAIGRGDYAQARQLISQAMNGASPGGTTTAGGMSGGGMGSGGMSPGQVGSGEPAGGQSPALGAPPQGQPSQSNQETPMNNEPAVFH